MPAVSTIGTEQLDQRLQQGGALQFWNVLPDTSFKGELIAVVRLVTSSAS